MKNVAENEGKKLLANNFKLQAIRDLICKVGELKTNTNNAEAAAAAVD